MTTFPYVMIAPVSRVAIPGATRICGDCGAQPGEFHQDGCDVQRCPRCGHQMISCDCVYEVNGLDPATLEETHPEIYANGPTEAMYEVWDRGWRGRLLPWTGVWPGDLEARALGLWGRWTGGVGYDWQPCDSTEPGAKGDLNRLHALCRWDADRAAWTRTTLIDS